MFDVMFKNVSVFNPRRALQSKVNAVAVYFPVDVLVNFNLIVLCDSDHCPLKPVTVMRRVSSSIKAAISQYKRFRFHPDVKNPTVAVGGYYVDESDFDLIGMLSSGQGDQLWMALLAKTPDYETGSDIDQWALVPVVAGSTPLMSDCDVLNDLTGTSVLSSSPTFPPAPPPSLDNSVANSTASTAEIPFPSTIPDLLDLVAVPTATMGEMDTANCLDEPGHQSSPLPSNQQCDAIFQPNAPAAPVESNEPNPPAPVSCPTLDETYTVAARDASAVSDFSLAGQANGDVSNNASTQRTLIRDDHQQRRVTFGLANLESHRHSTPAGTRSAFPDIASNAATPGNVIGNGTDSGIQVADSTQSSIDSLQDFSIFTKRPAAKCVSLFKTALMGKLTAEQTSAVIRHTIGKKNLYYLALRGPMVTKFTLKIDARLSVQLIRLIVKCNQLSGIYEVLRKAESTCWLPHPNKPQFSLFIGELSPFLVSTVIKFVRSRHGAPPAKTTFM